MKVLLFAAAFVALIFSVGTTIAEEDDFSKLIVGRWLGPKKFEIFHADGSWGVQRNESEPEKTTNLHWNIKGNKLTMSHPKNEKIPRVVLTIIELTSERLILEGGGVRVEYRRWAD